mmetsp:Transcript_10119/g.25220  ORF Transcript_10119/g.25220 Transcript_10119/m.25220 type:complete len:474 (+) Transcript_10119:67-1488(+)
MHSQPQHARPGPGYWEVSLPRARLPTLLPDFIPGGGGARGRGQSVPVLDVRLVAARALRHRAEGVHVDPVVDPVLDARLDGQRLVVSPIVALVRVRVEHGGPYTHGALLGRHGHVEPGEVGQPALVAVAHVHEDGEHARPPRGGARRVLVVVGLVELARLVPQHLHGLGVLHGDAHHAGDALLHRGDRGVLRTYAAAPRGRGRARRLHAVARHRALPHLAALRARPDDLVALLRGEEVVDREQPRAVRVARRPLRARAPLRRADARRRRVHGHALAPLAHDAQEDLVDRAGLGRGLHARAPLALGPVEAVLLARAARPRALLRQLRRRVAVERVGEVGGGGAAAPLGAVGQVVLARLRLAHLARDGAVGEHEARVGLALADRRPRRTVVVRVLTRAALLGRWLAAVAHAAGRLAARLHEGRVVVALAALGPVGAVLMLVDARRVDPPRRSLGLDGSLPPRWCRLRRDRPSALL